MQAIAAAPLLSAAVGVSTAGTLLSGVSQIQSSRFEQQVLNRQAEVDEANAVQAASSSQVAQQDRDFAALQEIAALSASQGASGFARGVGSFARQSENLRTLARRDSLRIRHDGNMEAQNFRAQAASRRAQAGMSGRAATFGLISTGLNLGTTLLGGASAFNHQRATMMRLDALGAT